MEAITFTVPAIPVAQPRPKARAFAGHAQVYEAAKSHPVHAFKASVRHAAAEAYQGAPLECPLYVSLLFVFPRPANKRWKKRPMPREWCPKKPDADNLAKACQDCLNQLMWVDDSQIVLLDVCKVLAAGDEQPHVHITIAEVRHDPEQSIGCDLVKGLRPNKERVPRGQEGWLMSPDGT